jgi:hypothetical protein
MQLLKLSDKALNTLIETDKKHREAGTSCCTGCKNKKCNDKYKGRVTACTARK